MHTTVQRYMWISLTPMDNLQLSTALVRILGSSPEETRVEPFSNNVKHLQAFSPECSLLCKSLFDNFLSLSEPMYAGGEEF